MLINLCTRQRSEILFTIRKLIPMIDPFAILIQLIDPGLTCKNIVILWCHLENFCHRNRIQPVIKFLFTQIPEQGAFSISTNPKRRVGIDVRNYKIFTPSFVVEMRGTIESLTCCFWRLTVYSFLEEAVANNCVVDNLARPLIAVFEILMLSEKTFP